MAASDKATKEIDKRAKKFVDLMNKSYKKYASDAKRTAATGLGAESGKDPEYYENFPKLVFAINKGNTAFQTPLQKAEGLSAGRTKVCWSSHLVDKARHINTKVNGKTCNQAPQQLKALDGYHDQYKETWSANLKKAGLRNFANKFYWAKKDPPHVELPNSKIKDFGNSLVKQCLDDCARITRKLGKKKNVDFERDYASELAPYIEKYKSD